MGDEQTFLKAILDQPEDTALRLVYADWLEEHGDRDRAQFIRLECEQDTFSREDPKWAELRDRAAALAKPQVKEWFGEIAGLVEGYSTRRGFVDAVELSAARFVKNAERLFALAPVRDVFVTRHSSQLRAFAQCPQLARLTRLTFCDANADEGRVVNGMTSAGAARLAASPHLGNLRELSIPWNGIGPYGVQALAECSRLTGLRSLNLSGNHLGAQGARFLARAERMTALAELDLASTEIGDEGAEALALSPQLASLRTLTLTTNCIGARGAVALARSPHLQHLTALVLCGNPVSRVGKAQLRKRFGEAICRFR